MSLPPGLLSKGLPLLALLFLAVTLAVTLAGDFRSRPTPPPGGSAIATAPSGPASPLAHDHAEGSKNEGSHMQEGSGEETLSFPTTAPAVDPERQRRMGIFHYNTGNRSLFAGDWEAAVTEYEKALEHDPAILEAYINLSNALLTGKQFDRARDILQKLEQRAPEHAALHYNLACYFSLTHQEGRALESLGRALDLGYAPVATLGTDPDLANLRRSPGWRAWVRTREELSSAGL